MSKINDIFLKLNNIFLTGEEEKLYYKDISNPIRLYSINIGCTAEEPIKIYCEAKLTIGNDNSDIQYRSSLYNMTTSSFKGAFASDFDESWPYLLIDEEKIICYIDSYESISIGPMSFSLVNGETHLVNSSGLDYNIKFHIIRREEKREEIKESEKFTRFDIMDI